MEAAPIRTLEMVRRIRDEIRAETRDFTPDEFRAFIAQEAKKVVPGHVSRAVRRPAA